jgi:hypothetical protein
MRFLGVVAIFLLLSATSGAAVGSGPFVVINDTFYKKPAFTFEIDSRARNSMIGKTHWLSWTGSAATARTTLFTNSCRPNCGEGHFIQQAARVRFYNVSSCRGKKVFSDFSVSAANGEPLLSGNFRSLGYLRHC